MDSPSVIITHATPSAAYNWPAIIFPLLTAVVAAILVHILTKRRDWEKSIDALMESISEQISSTCESAVLAWQSKRGVARQSHIAATKWRLQLVSQSLAALEARSRRRHWVFKFAFIPWLESNAISLAPEMVAFRKALTDGDFEDPARPSKLRHKVSIEQAKGEIVTKLYAAWHGWL